MPVGSALSTFMHKYHTMHVMHLRSRPDLADFFVFACFTPHSTDRGTDQNMRIGSAINRLTEIRATWENVLEETSSLTQPLSSPRLLSEQG